MIFYAYDSMMMVLPKDLQFDLESMILTTLPTWPIASMTIDSNRSGNVQVEHYQPWLYGGVWFAATLRHRHTKAATAINGGVWLVIHFWLLQLFTE
jgi:hypothetical protein